MRCLEYHVRLYRRLLDVGFSSNDYTDISSSELDDILRKIKEMMEKYYLRVTYYE